MEKIYNISREDFVREYLSNDNIVECCQRKFYVPISDTEHGFVRSLRHARRTHNKFRLSVSDCSINLYYSSCKSLDKVTKEAIASLPVKRFNKTLIACGCNVRIK